MKVKKHVIFLGVRETVSAHIPNLGKLIPGKIYEVTDEKGIFLGHKKFRLGGIIGEFNASYFIEVDPEKTWESFFCFSETPPIVGETLHCTVVFSENSKVHEGLVHVGPITSVTVLGKETYGVTCAHADVIYFFVKLTPSS